MYIIVFDTKTPYVYEAVPIMFFPEGFTYEARFKRRLVSDDICRKLDKDNGSMKIEGEGTGVVCVRYKDDKATDDVVFPGKPNSNYKSFFFTGGMETIVPIREVKIESIREISKIVIIAYRVGRYIDFHGQTDYNAVKNHRAEMAEDIARNCDRNKHFVEADIRVRFQTAYSSDFDPRDESDRVGSRSLCWGNTVAQLHGLPYLSNTAFLFVQGMDVVGKTSRSRKRTRFRKGGSAAIRGKGHLCLKSNRTYELKLFEAYPCELVPGDIRGEVPSSWERREYVLEMDENFYVARRSQTAIGGYDSIEYNIPVRAGTQYGAGTITLNIPWADKNAISELLQLEYNVDGGWKNSTIWIGLTALLVFFLVSSTGFNLNESIVAWFSQYLLQPIPTVIGKVIEFFALVVGLLNFTVFLTEKLK
ncbi:MAG: hypothetical protein ABJG86_18585 [Nitratireductor sp.]|uniref:hypothetical protein n=2 Tax=Pseudomonadota TaxID=1224 RepID=UPI003286524A